jgi:SAM-dependent methyltransferase
MITAAPQCYWDELYESRPLSYDEQDIPFRDVFEAYLPGHGTCFEVGCYPGSFLAYLGRRLGYTVSGIDATPAVEGSLPRFLESQGVRVGQLFRGDFFTADIDEQYDVVCSFGFIEHFSDLHQVLQRHMLLVAPRGRLIVACPNFRGAQWLLHRWLDPVNLSRHVVATMNPRRWKSILEAEGFSVLHCAYYRTFDFWTEDAIRGRFNHAAKQFIVRFGRAVDRRVLCPSPWFSPYMILVAQRP